MTYNSTMDIRVLTQAYKNGQHDALAKFGAEAPGLLDKIRGFASTAALPSVAGVAGAGAGIWDLMHGRGVGGSMGTMIGTGGGGLLGGWGGKALAQRFGVPVGLGQALGTGVGALLGRSATKETSPVVNPYAQPY